MEMGVCVASWMLVGNEDGAFCQQKSIRDALVVKREGVKRENVRREDVKGLPPLSVHSPRSPPQSPDFPVS